jgi:hypothetical protein
MQFFHPTLHLSRETTLDAPDAYYLHVVTFCPRARFRANGHEIVGFHTGNTIEGSYKIKVKLFEDAALPDLDALTPVVHTLALGSIAFPEGEGWFEVQVIGETLDTSGGGTLSRSGEPKTGGTSTVSTVSADNKTRPIEDDKL